MYTDQLYYKLWWLYNILYQNQGVYDIKWNLKIIFLWYNKQEWKLGKDAFNVIILIAFLNSIKHKIMILKSESYKEYSINSA
jgi:hypothetical protein